MEKVSVIIPIFNAETTLHRCIDSVLAQEHTEWELLLVNDGSSDKTAEICAHYTALDPRIRYFESEHTGPSAARNIGLANCLGTYVCFVDADDYAREDYISKLLAPFLYLPVQMSFSGYYEVSRRKPIPRPIHDLKSVIDCGVINADLFQQKIPYGTTGVICGKMFLMSVIRKHSLRFNCDLMIQEDLIFILKYSNMITNVAIIEDYLYYYDRSNQSSLSAVRDERYFKNALRATEYLKEFYRHSDHSLILASRRRAAVLTYFDAVALNGLSRRDKVLTIRELYKVYAKDLRTIPQDAISIKVMLFLFRYSYLNAYIELRKILHKERNARGLF